MVKVTLYIRTDTMNLLSLVYIFTFLVFEVTAQCPALYKRYSKEHTFCKPPNRNCKIVKSSVSKEDMKAILDEHNTLRSKIATGEQEKLPSASDMLQLEWDAELADVAQKHASLCQFDHDCNNCRRVQNFDVGQNLALETYAKGSIPSPKWRNMIKAWYDEVKLFQKSLISPFVPAPSDDSYGHFSQVVWASSYRVGCGYALYEDGNKLKALYTCHYGEGGNLDKGTMYKAGAVCSACPINSCCDKTCGGKSQYPGLCKITDNRSPTYKTPVGNFFYCDFHKQSDCKIDIKGANKWVTQNTLSGNYQSIILKGGEKSTISFATSLKPKTGSFCFSMNYRRGPNVDGEEDSSTLTVTFTVVESNEEVTKTLKPRDPKYRHDFGKFSLTLGWNMETKAEVQFSVPEGKPQQFFDIQSVLAKEGKC